MKSRSEAFFKEATKNLQLAKNELFKPSEDIVTYSVCKNAQFATENFLKGFLSKNGIEIGINETIETLYNKCVAIDENFKNIDLNPIGCKSHAIDSRYCSEINSVSACFDTADIIDTYLRKVKVL
ncbi:HEPN domain-containing protein [Lutibacter flavus]|uniref:HEPN domain-containing protein n=1 Tax=Lutibacter flavus TaxID=691689 RepID=A0A238VT79_9FLAO|nr:HEPN domain-containing protein [Lutibacter flavus]SNR37357.1 HEPN domain-containing protein [Lutibacter flavus]